MRVVFCFAGKTFTGPILDLVNEYRKRISRYPRVEIIEAKTLRKQTREGVHVCLSPDGESLNSKALAAYVSGHLDRGMKHIFFYTGAPAGHDPALARQADLVLSLSGMTFNHQIVRIMLLEQVYRVFTIIHGEPYHK